MDSLPPESHQGSEPGDRLAMMDTGCFSDRATRWSIIGARHGIAFTYPLADRRILDFALSLPTHLLVEGGFSRQPYRNAMEGILPEAIRWRESKYVPFPDIPANIVATAPGLLAHVDRIRNCAAVTDMFQLDAIAGAIARVARVAPYRFETGSTSKAVGQPSMPYPMKMAIHAVRALAVARYVARMS
jgi:asparagine synthase (glutamine-hydrolysing)